jgi:hypothetical protein
MRRIGGDVNRRPGANRGCLAAKGKFNLTVNEREHLVEVMTMGRRPTPGRHVHVNQTITAVGIFAAEKDSIDVPDKADVTRRGIIWAGHRHLRLGSSGGIAVVLVILLLLA